MRKENTSPEQQGQHFDHFVDLLAGVIGRADRIKSLRSYSLGLILPGERKSVEPMAARVEPGNVRSKHQSMHHFIAEAPWDDTAVLDPVRAYALPALPRHGGIEAWLVDDTGFPKKGTHSVGVARQYCGQLGKTANCQVAVTLSLANTWSRLPMACRLYLPKEWAGDPARRKKAGVPKEITFQTKPQIALAQIRAAQAAGVPTGVVVSDAGFGNNTDFRDGVTALGLRYAVGIAETTTVWPTGQQPRPPAPGTGPGRPPTRVRRTADHPPVTAQQLALGLPPKAFRKVTWREGTRGRLRSRFATVRVRPAHEDFRRPAARAEEWLLIEWPAGEKEPTKYWLSTLPPTPAVRRLVYTVKLRWRIERDYQELKDEIGLGHFEGRGWRGFHHHATMSIAAYAFLVAERGLFPPQGTEGAAKRRAPEVPEGYRPRGAAVAAGAA